ncbi:adenosylcobinamide-phosphate synthase CbiB [Ramlibacter sp. 2FC]|uniref:adenosylcobinamide-phosphate synthase CbiB n=1 Tax=Ramlibacter sp. 2FC TaxID=2502188 RepID=UPI0010F7FB23|nr:adenosylcobinamide-phosphate synthase CbiB [Ramlibacter sp. 2FC]
MLSAEVLSAAVLVALALDRWLGEPPARWHPVVWIGHFLGWAGRRVAPPAGAQAAALDGASLLRGSLAWCAGAACVLALAAGLQLLLVQAPAWLAALVLGLLLKPLLAWRMLRGEVQAVEAALALSLEAGRERLSWLVSRDVTALSENAVRESAIESLAENLNDSVIAPLFWFAIAGLPGAALYRFANTADAMWGYRGEREGRVWEWAGKWAARADDALSWLPARLTALLLALPAGGLSWRALRREAARTPSPNSGWPMAAMALALGLRLAKPGVYVLNEAGRPPQGPDTARACALAGHSLALLVGLAALVLLVLAAGGAHG